MTAQIAEEAAEMLEKLHGWGVPYTAIAILLGVNERTVRRWAYGESEPDHATTYRLYLLVQLDKLQPQNSSAVYVR